LTALFVSAFGVNRVVVADVLAQPLQIAFPPNYSIVEAALPHAANYASAPHRSRRQRFECLNDL